jgi:drug/metabolite transporter (DMT)-like permease
MPADPAGDAPRRHRGELFAALAAMGFGSAYVATSFALLAFEPLPAAVWRSIVGALGIGLIMALRARRASPGDAPVPAEAAVPRAPSATLAARAIRLLVIATFGGPLFLASMNFAVDHVGATIAAFVAGLYAVLAAVIAPVLLPERLTPRALAGFVLALGGTALLAELDPAGTDAVGMGWGILAAICFALYLVLARRWSARYRLDGLAIALATITLTALVLGSIVLVTDPASLWPSALPVEAVVAVAWLAAVSALGQVLMMASVRLIHAARSAAFLLLNPITATVLAAILLGERPSPLQVAGGVLVLLGMAAATIPSGSARLRGGSLRR